MKTIEDVKAFLDDFFESEYNLHIKSNMLEGTRDNYIDSVYDFFEKAMYLTAEDNFVALTAWSDDEDLESRNNFIEKVLRKRKLFAIEQYLGSKFDSSIENEGVDSTLFLCYVSDYNKITNDDYFERFYIAVMGDDLKLVAVDSMTHDDGWKEIAEFPSVIEMGERTKVEKYDAPVDEKDLEHYNSL